MRTTGGEIAATYDAEIANPLVLKPGPGLTGMCTTSMSSLLRSAMSCGAICFPGAWRRWYIIRARHRQNCYPDLARYSMPVAERLANEVVSLQSHLHAHRLMMPVKLQLISMNSRFDSPQ